jgi:phosphoribosyl 1,2-cyclic phosphodiesterase
MGYGGNTPCVELRADDGTVCLFDAGSGARPAGIEIGSESNPPVATIHCFISHYHWDHIQGVPFFGPLYNQAQRVAFRAVGTLGNVRERLCGQMSMPYFPVDLAEIAKHNSFEELDGAAFRLGSLTVHPFALNHPQGSYGFRVESGSSVFVYACDHEPGNAAADKRLRDYAQGAGLLICDAQYTPEEYPKHVGWGHGTWLEATNAGRDAGVQRLMLFHHDPDHDDEFLREVGIRARARFEALYVAQEGSIIDL